MNTMIEIQHLYKTYHAKSGDVDAVHNVDLTVQEGEIYGVIGYSGAGKSSLIRCINLLEIPDSGNITVGGEKLTWMENDTMKVIKNKDGVDGYLFIRNTYMPAVIVECAFIDNAKDFAIIDTAAERTAMGIAIAKGVLKTLGIAWQAPASKLYRVQIGAYRVKANAENQLKKAVSAGFTDAFITEVNA